jgi:sporulation protein YunB
MVRVYKKIKSKMTRRQKLFVFACIFFFTCFLMLNYLNKNVNPVIISVSEAKVSSLSVKAVNNAIGEVVGDGTVYNDLVSIQQDSDGQVTLIQANAIEINKLSKNLANATQANLENMGTSGIKIPLGSFSGLPVLNGMGPRVNIRLLPVGSINCSFVSEFKSAGINQTHHKIYVNVETKVNLVLPLATKYITTNTQMLICESIIVGKVPEVYLNSNDYENALNLVPDTR